jgi:hypothetical protein
MLLCICKFNSGLQLVYKVVIHYKIICLVHGHLKYVHSFDSKVI